MKCSDCGEELVEEDVWMKDNKPYCATCWPIVIILRR